jgi:hypothetical protein
MLQHYSLIVFTPRLSNDIWKLSLMSKFFLENLLSLSILCLFLPINGLNERRIAKFGKIIWSLCKYKLKIMFLPHRKHLTLPLKDQQVSGVLGSSCWLLWDSDPGLTQHISIEFFHNIKEHVIILMNRFLKTTTGSIYLHPILLKQVNGCFYLTQHAWCLVVIWTEEIPLFSILEFKDLE